MKAHGFNYVRLRTFVDPKAADGYDKTNGYDDITHTVAFGKQVKDAGMGLLVDFHYSDNWADPGQAVRPGRLAEPTRRSPISRRAVHDYTKDAITQLIAGGARPDMVQIGNEEHARHPDSPLRRRRAAQGGHRRLQRGQRRDLPLLVHRRRRAARPAAPPPAAGPTWACC